MYPRIGIRPVIDGRQMGIRESLEDQTMNMAKAAKALIEANCTYPDGTPVECVIGPCTIGGGAEAAKTQEYFSTRTCGWPANSSFSARSRSSTGVQPALCSL